ncbi:MAG: FkbM family methyltransferase [Bacteroidetes bacterium]|nr:FkbM family methyltransferase [Bacteroidota bacterium]
MKIIKLTNKLLQHFKAQIVRYPSIDVARRIKIINYYKINTIIDVGANVGNYAIELYSLGYKNKIISFEPLIQEFTELKNNTKKYKNWTCYNYALGDSNENSIINVAGNKDSSSILKMLDTHVDNAPNSKYIGKQEIQIKSLDSIKDSLFNETDNVFLKIDTQGFEMNVLKGAIKSLKFIKCIQIELSIVQLYEGSSDYRLIIDFLLNKGFSLISIENGFSNPTTGELLQFDGIFSRK